MSLRDVTVNIQINDSTAVIGKKVFINRIELPEPPTGCNNVTTINGEVFIDGYEFKNGKWKKTLRAWLHLWF